MKPTVSQQTAQKLAEAGFMPPGVVEKWQSYWAYGDLCAVEYASSAGSIDLIRPAARTIEFTGEQFRRNATFAPTATDILSQFPGRLSQGIDRQWECRFTITQYNDDCYYDACPHECAAKAFLAWEAGLR